MNQIDPILDRPEKREVINRIENLYNEANKQGGEWDAIFLLDRINHYYFTGTMQDGLFVLKKDGSYAYFVRRSFERAKNECLIDNVYPMSGYGDVQKAIGADIGGILTETEVITYAALERLRKYFNIGAVGSVEKAVMKVRSVKSWYELSCMRESGKRHGYLLDNVVPSLLREGMSEAEFTAAMYEKMILMGYHGVTRFSMSQTEIVVGQIGFGENSLYPTSFDGPGGMKGLHPAAPVVGDRKRLLKKGDLVFVDCAFGINGYYTDRTQVYMFGKYPSDEMLKIHRECIRVEKETAALLKPGGIPGDIYESVLSGLDNGFAQGFMGFGDRTVNFLGHGIGLRVDELPVLAKGFREPLAKDMVIAIEPKKGVSGIGVLGVEDTYIVTENGGECITGGEKDIIVV